eukprot:UN30561
MVEEKRDYVNAYLKRDPIAIANNKFIFKEEEKLQHEFKRLTLCRQDRTDYEAIRDNQGNVWPSGAFVYGNCKICSVSVGEGTWIGEMEEGKPRDKTLGKIEFGDISVTTLLKDSKPYKSCRIYYKENNEIPSKKEDFYHYLARHRLWFLIEQFKTTDDVWKVGGLNANIIQKILGSKTWTSKLWKLMHYSSEFNHK